MISTSKSQSEGYKGAYPSGSPTNLPSGSFSSVVNAVPKQGSAARIPGKTFRDLGITTGGILSIYQFGTMVVVQSYTGLILFDLLIVSPTVEDYVYDNEGNLVYDNLGLPVIAG